MREIIELGSAPYEESSAQTLDPNYQELSAKECNAFIAQLYRMLKHNGMNIPEGFRIYKKSFPHDFGFYYEVVCSFECDSEESESLAYYLDANIPSTWDEESLKFLNKEQ